MNISNEGLKVGSELMAKWTENLIDHVTKGKIYKVVEISHAGFFILNDKGEKRFPVSTTFTRIS